MLTDSLSIQRKKQKQTKEKDKEKEWNKEITPKYQIGIESPP